MLEGAEQLTDDTSRPERATITDALPSPNTAPRFNAFLSYCRTPDENLARALQDGLHQFARPWNRLRALRVFRDKASLSASETLRGSLEDALADSDFLILLASPGAAQSLWVGREADWWCSHRKRAHFLIALTEGEIVWDSARGDFDWERTTALPPVLRGRFPEEPLHIDLRWAQPQRRSLAARPALPGLRRRPRCAPARPAEGRTDRRRYPAAQALRAVPPRGVRRDWRSGGRRWRRGLCRRAAARQRSAAAQPGAGTPACGGQARLRASHAGDAVSTELAARPGRRIAAAAAQRRCVLRRRHAAAGAADGAHPA